MTNSRRSFLLRSAALAGATWFDIPGILAGTIEESRKRFGGWDFGIQGHSLREYPLERAVEIIDRELDLRWVEFSRAHLPLQPRAGGRYKGPAVTLGRINDVKALLRKRGMGMRATASISSARTPPPTERYSSWPRRSESAI